MTQLGMEYTELRVEASGNAPSGIESIEIGSDGTMYAQYENGSFRELYRIPLANVQSPDMLTALPGNVYTPSSDSGDLQMGFPGSGGLGSMISGALENSNVDIAEELTNMIESQRSYTANSKVFQTGADLMDILVNLKR
jgi:flagellar hook protein FlgE